MRNKAKERKDIASLISVILSFFTLVLIIISAMFSSYSANISDNEKVIIEEKNIIISYDEGNTIEMKNISPGEGKRITFEISSKEDATTILEYDLTFELEDNTFNPEFILYKIDSSSSLKSASGNLVSVSEYQNFVDYDSPHFHGSIKPGEVQKYDFDLYYSVSGSVRKNHIKGNINVDILS